MMLIVFSLVRFSVDGDVVDGIDGVVLAVVHDHEVFVVVVVGGVGGGGVGVNVVVV